MIHELKISPDYFDAVANDIKTFEVRQKDRPFKVGDTLLLREYIATEDRYTGRETVKAITYVMDNEYCLSGYVILGITRAFSSVTYANSLHSTSMKQVVKK